MQRLHAEDLVGDLLRSGGWVHLDLPAIAGTEERFDLGNGRVVGRRPGGARRAMLPQIARPTGRWRERARAPSRRS